MSAVSSSCEVVKSFDSVLALPQHALAMHGRSIEIIHMWCTCSKLWIDAETEEALNISKSSDSANSLGNLEPQVTYHEHSDQYQGWAGWHPMRETARSTRAAAANEHQESWANRCKGTFPWKPFCQAGCTVLLDSLNSSLLSLLFIYLLFSHDLWVCFMPVSGPFVLSSRRVHAESRRMSNASANSDYEEAVAISGFIYTAENLLRVFPGSNNKQTEEVGSVARSRSTLTCSPRSHGAF